MLVTCLTPFLKWTIQSLALNSMFNILQNVTVAAFYGVCCTYHGSSEMKCPLLHLKLTYYPHWYLNLTDNGNKSKCEMKTHLLKQLCCFSFLIQGLELFWLLYQYHNRNLCEKEQTLWVFLLHIVFISHGNRNVCIGFQFCRNVGSHVFLTRLCWC